MTTYDWIVIGGGITGSCLAYELSKQNFQVLLLEKNQTPDNATLYSYGGLAYWSGTTELTRQLSQSGIELHRQLSAELDADTEFRELDLILTVDQQDNPLKVAQNYQQFSIQPEILNVVEACELEPLLNPDAIAGALKLPHGHINPQKTTQAYQNAFLRNGGEIEYQSVTNFLKNNGSIAGVQTNNDLYYAANTVVCAGGLSRALLQQTGIKVSNYFTHAQLIKTPPVDLQLQTIVMPAVQQRFALEAQAKNLALNSSWDFPKNKIVNSILDVGAVQFLDGSFCLGQISAIVTNPLTQPDAIAGESHIRQGVSSVLPSLSKLPGTCHHCLVAFNNQAIALVGKIKQTDNLYLFSGFTSTLLFAPILARHFANSRINQQHDAIIQELNQALGS